MHKKQANKNKKQKTSTTCQVHNCCVCVCVWVVSGLTTLQWAATKGSSLGEVDSPSPSSHSLPVVLCLGKKPDKKFPFHGTMPIDVVIFLVLFI